jgi:HD domain
MPLKIERALERARGSFIDKYRLMKERLLTTEYEHWAAGFPEGNNHGKGHITRVLEYLDHLLGPKPLEHLDPYELFLAMMAILYHDIGLLHQRRGHEEISKALLEGDTNDAYIINPIDKEIIAAAVVSHSSSKDIAQECSRFSAEEPIGKYRARPTVVAALVRLSDELDEDHRRADPILQQRLKLPPESAFFWLFCQRVRGVRPDLTSKRIDVNLAFEAQDTRNYGPVPGGRARSFVAFSAEKLAKINQERVYVNRFLPQELRYAGLHVDLKPIREHPKWRAPRTFVFNDRTTAEMFLKSFPELFDEPANDAMKGVLAFMKQGDLGKAEEELTRFARVAGGSPDASANANLIRPSLCSVDEGSTPSFQLERTQTIAGRG